MPYNAAFLKKVELNFFSFIILMPALSFHFPGFMNFYVASLLNMFDKSKITHTNINIVAY